MFENLRQSMAWLHTWLGLVLGFVLMVCFFFGSLTVFDREIDRWAIPQTRFEPIPMPSFDRLLKPVMQRMAPHPSELELLRTTHGLAVSADQHFPLSSFYAYTTHRDASLWVGAEFELPMGVKAPPSASGVHAHGWMVIDPRNGAEIPERHLQIGSDWFYPMHYKLHIKWKNLGHWAVGLASLVMLVAIVSGVIMHRRVFREFFTFRPKKHVQRSALDLHNLSGLVALPFHVVFAFTGLLIFAGMYLPVSNVIVSPFAGGGHGSPASQSLPAEPSGTPAALASVDAMVQSALRRWNEAGHPGDVGGIVLTHAGDANAYVTVYRAGRDRLIWIGQGVRFSGVTGKIIHEDPPPSGAVGLKDALAGIHFMYYEHWLLRWLYVLGGLLGCVCIATGFIFFVEKRKKKHAEIGSLGSRVVDALAVTTVTGMVIAAVGMLVVNRVLPADMADKGDWEKLAFCGLWMLAMAHAFVRSGPVAQAQMNPAWREQCWALAALSVAAVVLNALTTGDHLLKTLAQPYWPVAGMDLSLLAAAGVAACAARMLAARESRSGDAAPRQGSAGDGDDALDANERIVQPLPAGVAAAVRCGADRDLPASGASGV